MAEGQPHGRTSSRDFIILQRAGVFRALAVFAPPSAQSFHSHMGFQPCPRTQEMADSLPWGLLVAVPENQSLIIPGSPPL